MARAARCAFWLAFALLNSGDLARGGGWVDRAQRLLDETPSSTASSTGYLRYAAALRAVFSGDVESAHRRFREAPGIGERFRDPELITLARIGEGRCLIYSGEVDGRRRPARRGDGRRGHDGDLADRHGRRVLHGDRRLPRAVRRRTGQRVDGRAQPWCDAQPELVLYRGECLVHRAEIMLLARAVVDGASTSSTARWRGSPSPPRHRILGAASYLRGELHRLTGEQDDAEDAYRVAREGGRDPQPGVALLRLAQGRTTDADAAIRRALNEAEDPITRIRVLGPYVEIVARRRRRRRRAGPPPTSSPDSPTPCHSRW